MIQGNYIKHFRMLASVSLMLVFQGCGSENKNSNSSASISSASISSASISSSLSSSSIYSADVESIKEYASFPIEVRVKDSLSSQGILDNDQEQELVEKHFDQFTSNDLNGSAIHASPDTYDFRVADDLVDYALQNSLNVHGGPLIDVNVRELPNYLVPESYENYEDFIVALEKHVTTIVGHFSGKKNLVSWNIVDGLSQRSIYRNPEYDVFYQTTEEGLALIERLFRAAKQAAPDVTLYIGKSYNSGDSGGYYTSQFITAVKYLKEKGVPIDGVSVSRTINASAGSIGQHYADISFRDTVKAMVELGLLIKLEYVKVGVDLDSYGPVEQGAKYCTLVKEYLDLVPENLRGGISLAATVDTAVKQEEYLNIPMLFDINYGDKPALRGFADALSESACENL